MMMMNNGYAVLNFISVAIVTYCNRQTVCKVNDYGWMELHSSFSTHAICVRNIADFLPGSNADLSPALNIYAKNDGNLPPLHTMPSLCSAVSCQPPTAESRVQSWVSTWDSWWTKWQWDRFRTKYISFLVTTIPLVLCIHSSITDAV